MNVMSEDTFLRILFLTVLSVALGRVVYTRQDDDLVRQDSNRQRYLPYINSLLLPIYLLTLTILMIPTYGFWETAELMLPMCFTIFLHISIYYLILLLFSGYLRKRISARTCAALWILPNYSYLLFNRAISMEKPRYILHISDTVFWVLGAVWLVGFIIVLTHAYVQHFQFRRHILTDAREITDPAVLRIWESEIADARVTKPLFKLVESSAVTSPLSIGFFRRTIRVVVPQRKYTEDELALIFRHELVHICRGDTENKFFFVFNRAMCWFNPLMWIAMQKSAEDLELSCDETVLLDADESRRHTYAQLILDSVQDGRGFTTCLSAAATFIRYRLRNIVKKRDLNTGAICIALISFILFMSCGTVALAYGENTVLEEALSITSEIPMTDLNIYGLNLTAGDFRGAGHSNNEEALTEYISQLHVAHLNGGYQTSEKANYLLICYEGEDCNLGIEIRGQIMQIIPFGRNSQPLLAYYIIDDVDWVYLMSLFI